MAHARISAELQKITRGPPGNCSARPITRTDIYNWRADIMGPYNSPYQGGAFQLTIKFPGNYPASPPEVAFVTPIYHPNISTSGTICLNILKPSIWKPVTSVSKLLLSISALLGDPNPDDPLRPDVAHIYKNDRRRYNKEAADFTRQHAMSR